MSFSLYDAVVPSNLQILGAVATIVDKAENWCAENGHEADKVIGARLADDMLPFAYQVKSTAFHSAGALEGAREGCFRPTLRRRLVIFQASRPDWPMPLRRSNPSRLTK